MTRIVGVCGSRRAESTTRAAIAHALDAAADAGAEPDLLDLGTVDLPLYHPDRDEQGESAALCARVRSAHGMILGSPVYHGSYSSTFRNFHDYCGKSEYENTAVGLVATAGGGSYGPALEHMRSTVRGVHGWTVPEQVGLRKASRKVEGDRIVDADTRERLERVARQVVWTAERLHDRE